MDQNLNPGGIYNLPVVGVINAGKEASDYSLRITYLADRPEMRPPEDWFSFNPSVFRLEPGEDSRVDVQATAPVGKWLTVTAVVKNASSTVITSLGGAIRLPEGVSIVGDDDDGDEEEGASAVADLGALGANKEKKIEWRSVARAPGNYVIAVSVTWRDEASGELLDGEIGLTLEATEVSGGEDAGLRGVANFASRAWEGLREPFTGLINTVAQPVTSNGRSQVSGNGLDSPALRLHMYANRHQRPTNRRS